MPKINAFKTQKGWIEVICGPMFSGKSEELLRRINLLKYSDVKYILFTPDKDTRTGSRKAKSRDGRVIEAITVASSRDIINVINDNTYPIQVVGIDEAQFFDEELPDVCQYLANNGYIVIAAGLDMDSFQRPFNNVMRLLVYAEQVTKLKAICTNCGAAAAFSDTVVTRDKSQQIMVGDKNEYMARCRNCHSERNANPLNLPKVKRAE